MIMKKITGTALAALVLSAGVSFADLPAAAAAYSEHLAAEDASVQIDMQTAKEIALNHAGYTENQVIFKKTKLDWEHGQYIYEIEFLVGNVEYEYDISASSGAILSFEQDYDD